MKKLPTLGKLKKIADGLWSTLIRQRDKVCLICGGMDNLHAHHVIIRKRLSNKTRWSPCNGIALCYRCHMIKLHRDSDKDFLDVYMEKVNEKIPQEIQEELRNEAKEPCSDPSRADLEALINKLTILLQGDSV